MLLFNSINNKNISALVILQAVLHKFILVCLNTLLREGYYIIFSVKYNNKNISALVILQAVLHKFILVCLNTLLRGSFRDKYISALVILQACLV
jgi:hypothetical protein